MKANGRVPVSVLILTKNEQANLAGCLESVAWADDIHVYDSMSTDDTVPIADRFGAKVAQRGHLEAVAAFGGDEAAHRNWGLRHIRFKHPWVLQLDADERPTPELASEIERVVRSSPHAAYRIRRRDFLGSTWLKHAQATPFYLRLFRPDRVHYERLINPVTIVDGSIGHLDGYFDHYPFSKGYAHWIERHNWYSTLEAEQILETRTARKSFSLIQALTSATFHQRRYHQKELFYRLPFRPWLKFFFLYVGKGGFFDGRAGMTYAVLQAIYEYFIVLKTRELERGRRGAP